jgi:hypothetical protein
VKVALAAVPHPNPPRRHEREVERVKEKALRALAE